MTIALRSFALGVLCASLVAYLYKPDFIVLMVAFWIGHLIGIAVCMIDTND